MYYYKGANYERTRKIYATNEELIQDIGKAYRPGISPGETVTAVIRTNVVELSKEPVVGQWSIPCRIISNTLNGTHWRISVDIDGVEFKADLNNTSDKSIYVGWTPGENAYYTAKPENVWFFNK